MSVVNLRKTTHTHRIPWHGAGNRKVDKGPHFSLKVYTNSSKCTDPNTEKMSGMEDHTDQEEKTCSRGACANKNLVEHFKSKYNIF